MKSSLLTINENFVIAQLERFRKSKNLTVNEFAVRIGLQSSSYRNMVSGASNTPISKKVLISALSQFPDLNAEWLFRGVQSDNETLLSAESSMPYGNEDAVKEILHIVRRLEAAWDSIYRK